MSETSDSSGLSTEHKIRLCQCLTRSLNAATRFAHTSFMKSTHIVSVTQEENCRVTWNLRCKRESRSYRHISEPPSAPSVLGHDLIIGRLGEGETNRAASRSAGTTGAVVRVATDAIPYRPLGRVRHEIGSSRAIREVRCFAGNEKPSELAIGPKICTRRHARRRTVASANRRVTEGSRPPLLCGSYLARSQNRTGLPASIHFARDPKPILPTRQRVDRGGRAPRATASQP